MLQVHRYGSSVFLSRVPDYGPQTWREQARVTLYSHKFDTKRAAQRFSDGLCQEIAAGLPEHKLSIAADIEKRLEALRHLPPAWR